MLYTQVVPNELMSRITEINVGILCGCIPVAFTLFRSTYEWIENSLSSFRSRFTPSARGKESRKPGFTYDTDTSPPSLPAKIPRGVITGLRSLMQNHSISPSTKIEQAEFDNSVSTYVELESVEFKAPDQRWRNDVQN